MKTFALIFDCDGTLMDSMEKAVKSLHHVLHELGEEPRSTAEIESHFGVAADQILRELLGNEQKARQGFSIYKAHQAAIAPQTRIFPGIMEILERAQQAAVPMGVVTGRHREDLTILLGAHGLQRYFQAIVTDNELERPKPAPEGILRAAAQIGVPPTQVFYVGDTLNDMRAARAAGAFAIAALWGPGADAVGLRDLQPDLAAAHPDEVWSYFLQQTTAS